MEYSVEVRVGDASFFIEPDGFTLQQEPVYMDVYTMEEIMKNYQWDTAVESEPIFIVRAREVKNNFSVHVQAPDKLLRALMTNTNAIVKNNSLHRQLWYDQKNNWWVVTEQTPADRSPKVLHRSASLSDITKFFEGKENEDE